MPLNLVFSFKTGVRTNWIGRAPRVSPTGTFPTADAGALEVCACAEEVEEGPQRRLCDPPDVYSRLMQQCSGPGGDPGGGRCTSFACRKALRSKSSSRFELKCSKLNFDCIERIDIKRETVKWDEGSFGDIW